MGKSEAASRRTFIKQAASASVIAMLPAPHFAMGEKRKYKMGLQLFTIRDAMAKDPIDSLRKVGALGYEDLEIYGYDADKGTYYGFRAADFKQILTDHQLTATSGHYDFSSFFAKPFDELKRYLDKCIEGAHALGSPYITWPWLAPEYRSLDNFKLLTGKLNKMGERVKDAGLRLAYHNHDFEFTDHGGQNGYDIILGETDPGLVKLQIDLYWVVRSSKLSPKELLERQPGRYTMWHIKDMDKITKDYTELGNGSIDYVEMLSNISMDGLEYYYLEQGGNFTQNSIQSITDSATYFKTHLQRFL